MTIAYAMNTLGIKTTHQDILNSGFMSYHLLIKSMITPIENIPLLDFEKNYWHMGFIGNAKELVNLILKQRFEGKILTPDQITLLGYIKYHEPLESKKVSYYESH